MKTVSKKGLYDAQVFQNCLSRIEKLTPESQSLWGKMDVAQMLAHCAEIQEVSNGKPLKNTPFIAKLFKGMIKRKITNDKPYGKNGQTHPQYKIVDQKSFDTEKQRLLTALNVFIVEEKGGNHSFLGHMTAQERGWSMYKHLDHHLQQFGV